MKIVCVLFFLVVAVAFVHAQDEQVFYVHKQKKATERTKVYKLAFYEGIDTLFDSKASNTCTSILPVVGLYDSVHVFNAEYAVNSGRFCLYPKTLRTSFKVVLRLFKKLENGTFKVIFMRSFIVPGKEM